MNAILGLTRPPFRKLCEAMRWPVSRDVASVPAGTIPLHADGAASYEILGENSVRSPLILSSPHSGRAYPAEFLEACQADLMDLRRIEDAYVDHLAIDAPQLTGAPLIRALIGRACVDLNRAENELDASMFTDAFSEIAVSRSPRVAAGLGCIPRIAHAGTRIYGRKLATPIARRRLNDIHRPYHGALNALVGEAQARFGASYLVDLHSMPSCTESGVLLPDIILGDRFGGACDPDLTATLEQALRDRGYSVSRNAPYAGGYITLSQGMPDMDRHAIQIEINRRLYLDERNVEKTSDFATLKRDLEEILVGVSEWACDHASNGADRDRRIA